MGCQETGPGDFACQEGEGAVPTYRELLRLADKVKGYVLEAIACLRTFVWANRDQTPSARIVADELETMVSRFQKVLDQTRRQVVQGEKVPPQAKILFACHADVIVKGGRDTQFGHIVFLTAGRSGLILDCRVPRSNPANTTLYPPLPTRQVELNRRPLRQVAAAGGFASQENLAPAQRSGVKDAMFAQKRGLRILDMVKSLWFYQKLRNFRAGI